MTYNKRLSAPKNYPIERKTEPYVVAAEGPHPADEGLPLTVVIRDALGYAETAAEVKQVCSEGKVLVNERVQKNPRTTVGFMDTLRFPDIDEQYRILVNRQGFVLQPIDEDAAKRKLARIDDKTTLKGGVTQLNLYDGNNIETDTVVDTRSSVLVSLPDLKIKEAFSLEEGSTAYIRGGKHIGQVATVQRIETGRGSNPSRVTLETEDGETFETIERNVYVIGADGPELDEIEEVVADE